MKNQDPLNPTDPTQFTGQLTQYSILEQSITTNNLLTTMSTQNSTQTAAGLTDYIGKEIKTSDVSGTVDAVDFEPDQAYFVVGGALVDPADVISVTNPGTSASA